MAQPAENTHNLYHEAKRRASRPQLPIKHTAAKDLLLSSPNSIIFELFNTVVKAITSDTMLDFIQTHLREYLDVNWANKITQQVIKRLTRDQALDVRAGLTSAPSLLQVYSPSNSSIHHKSPNLSPSSPQTAQSKDDSEPKQKSQSKSRSSKSPPVDYKKNTSKEKAIDQIFEHVMWRIRSENVTQITSLLTKLVIDYGYKNQKLKSELYDDVVDNFRDWRANKLIKLYSFGSAPANDQKLLLTSTDHGDITKWVANYIDGSEKRQQPDLLRKLALALRDKTKNCIFLTNELIDAIQSVETGGIRCALLVDRLNQFEQIELLENFTDKIKPMLVSGQLYIISSLDCVEFVPDPNNDTCC